MSKTQESASFFGTGVFDWQLPADRQAEWGRYVYDEARHWGDFPRDLAAPEDLNREYPWAIGPFVKYPGNPILAPSKDGWDCGRYNGGVHNGSIIIHNDIFHYVYRGERPIDVPLKCDPDYMCDIGLATSTDGIHFNRDTNVSPFFRKGNRRRFSYEDVNIVRHGGVYFLFCNQWDWENFHDYRVSGTFLATSTDLRHWQPRGIVFPDATRTHRNGVVLQNATNDAVRVNGQFVMYLNDGLIAYSEDLLTWKSRDAKHRWPGGEGCFALTDHEANYPERIVLFTGGHHTGHFYAIGEVMFDKRDPEEPLAWLPRPILQADPKTPYESGHLAEPPHRPISSFRDCIFFNALTRYRGKWWLYYGGSEYYTCLATAIA